MGNAFDKSNKQKESEVSESEKWEMTINKSFTGTTRVDLGFTGYKGGMGDDGAFVVARNLADCKNEVTSLDLYRHDIGVRGANVLCEAIGSNTCLVKINLNHNKFGDDGAIALANALKFNSSIEEIHLDENSIGDAGVIALAAVLSTHRSLKKVYLTENLFGVEGKRALEEAKASNDKLSANFYF